jgi:hypothetical protein
VDVGLHDVSCVDSVGPVYWFAGASRPAGWVR